MGDGLTELGSSEERELTSIQNEISSLASYRMSLLTELRALHQKRRDLQNEVRLLNVKVREVRLSLRDYNLKSQQYEETRRVVLAQLRQARAKSGETQKLLRQYESRLPPEASENSMKTLKEAEWKLQTAKLTREEEKSLVRRITKLESTVSLWKKSVQARDEVKKLLEERRSLKVRLDELDKLDESLYREFGGSREKLSNVAKGRDQLFRELDELGNEIGDLNSKLAESSARLDELRQVRMKILLEMRMKERRTAAEKRSRLLAEAQRAAMEKLSRGEKLSLDELRLALGEDEVESLK